MAEPDSERSVPVFQTCHFAADVYQIITIGPPWRVNFQGFARKEARVKPGAAPGKPGRDGGGSGGALGELWEVLDLIV